MNTAKKVDILDYLKRHPELRVKDLDKEAWYWSDFSNQKNFNPKLFNDSLKFWSNVLIETSKRGWLSEDILCLNRESLEETFSVYNGVSPAGFNCVIRELYHSSELIPIDELYSSMTWSGWILQSLFWGLQKATGSNNVLVSKKLVIIPTLKEAAERVLQHHEKNAVHGITDNLFTLTSFKAEYASVAVPNVVLSDIDLKVLLYYLEFGEKMLVTEVWYGISDEEKEEEFIIKMRSRKDKNISKLEISEVDRGIICIKETSRKLHIQIEGVEEKITDLNKKISGYLIRKQKVQAKYSLKQKKNLEKILSKRMGSLGAIEGILLKIEGAASDSEIIDIYSFGAGALKGVLASEGLTTETVDTTMDKLQDALADQKEIEDAMQVNQTLIEASLDIDEELEEELEALLKEEDTISTPAKQSVPQPIIDSTIEGSTAKKAIVQSDKTPLSTLQPVSNVIEDKELEELEKMFAEMEALPSAPQHTPRTADSRSKQREEITTE
ncbi:Snf7-domain-containing protein [Glomus cerebriforme]|uniref:Snf7-domain-containing protein n=1 Tax=Glomus cerebriforme TaxID=658196 RepID=A0A397SY75_9GLOM|nr:Snf7-domain-containing protein [Glomus cerebriforme]